MIKLIIMAVLTGMLFLNSFVVAQQTLPELSKQVPYLTQRLQSKRWEVRYSLVNNLKGRDLETKQALEMLVQDEHKSVANQALVLYLYGFVDINKTLFKPELYVPGKFPIEDLPDDDSSSALVDYCLGRSDIPRKGRFMRHDMQPVILVLDPAHLDHPRMDNALTIVGILGKPDDAKTLYPFLQSTNDYVALVAAKAVILLGDKQKGLEALCRLTEGDPSKHLHYITAAFHALKEMKHPELEAMVIRVLSSVDSIEGIHPGRLGEFLLLAAEITDKDVWAAKEQHNKPDVGDGN